MFSKKNTKMIEEKNRDERQRFSIRKLTIGAASVLVGVSFFAYGGQEVHAATESGKASSAVVSEVKNDNTADQGKSTAAADDKATETTDKTAQVDVSQVAGTKSDSANNEEKSNEAQIVKANDVERATDETVETTADNAGDASLATIKKDTAKVESDNKDDAAKKTADKVKSETGDAVVKADEAKKAEDSAEATVKDDQIMADDSKTTVKNRDLKVDAKVLAAEAEDPNAVTVDNAKDFINAIQNGTATTINVAADINLATVTDSNYTYISKINTRDFTIKSATDGVKHTIDFSGYVFNMSTQNTVTFKDLDIYARSYWGIVYNAGGYTFDNVNFTGSQLIYTTPSINSTLTFKNTVNANSVSSYVGPLDGKTRDTQQNGGQQILQFQGGTNQIIFDENSNVTLTTEDANALEMMAVQPQLT